MQSDMYIYSYDEQLETNYMYCTSEQALSSIHHECSNTRVHSQFTNLTIEIATQNNDLSDEVLKSEEEDSAPPLEKGQGNV